MTISSWWGNSPVEAPATTNIEMATKQAKKEVEVEKKVQDVAQERLKKLDTYNYWFKPVTYTFGGIEIAGSLAGAAYCVSLIVAGATGAGLAWSITGLILGILHHSLSACVLRNSISIEDIESEMRASITSGDEKSFRRAAKELGELKEKDPLLSFYAQRKVRHLGRLADDCLDTDVTWTKA